LIFHHSFFYNLKLEISLLILVIFHGWKCKSLLKDLFDKSLKTRYPWKRTPIQLLLFVNLLYAISYSFLVIYLYFDATKKFQGYAMIIPAALACGVSCICVSYEETPCNAAMQLLTKVITVLRLLIGVSAYLKIDHLASWEWSTTFWPYWCSFAIQAILGIASFVIFMNTVMNYYKKDAPFYDSMAYLSLTIYSIGIILGVHCDLWLRDSYLASYNKYNLIYRFFNPGLVISVPIRLFINR
jgi:hypothetical protein